MPLTDLQDLEFTLVSTTQPGFISEIRDQNGNVVCLIPEGASSVHLALMASSPRLLALATMLGHSYQTALDDLGISETARSRLPSLRRLEGLILEIQRSR